MAQKILREAEIERQRREIAEAVRARIVVDKTVAEEEERIKDVRTLADANRKRESAKIGAEAEAAQHLVKQVKAAEAAEEVTKSNARQRLITADAELEAADRLARAKVRLAEGNQAEAAATGLADVRVREANASVIERQGLVDANVLKERLSAEAQGTELKGVAAAKVREADARALELQGLAEANAVRAKMSAEADGIAQKAEAMKALDSVSREHEEFRLRLEQSKVIALESIRAKKDVAGVQAEVLRAAFEHAKINIVGGDGQFFERFMRAVTVGQSIDSAVDQSDTLKSLLSQVTGNKPSDDSSAS
jgi:hypothetical protein